MKSILILGLLCYYGAVESKTVFERIRSDIQTTRQNIKCGLHKIGNVLVKHEHERDPCQKNDHHQQPIELTIPVVKATEPTKVHLQEQKIDEIQFPVDVEKTTEKNDSTKAQEENDEWHPLIDQRMGDTNRTKPKGKNLFVVPGNCDQGYVLDSQGNCREEY